MKRQKETLKKLIKEYFSFQDVKKAFTLLKPFVRTQWNAYLLLFVLLAMDVFLTIAFAWFFGHIADAAIQSNFNQIKWLVPLGLFLVLLRISSSFFEIYFEAVVTNGVKRDVKIHLYQHILRLPTKNTSKLHSGQLLSHFTNDIHSIDGVIGRSLIDLIRLPIIYTAVLIYLLHINWTLSIISFFIGPIAILSGVFFGILLRRNSRRLYQLMSDITTFLNESFQGLQVIRSFTLEKSQYKKFLNKSNALFDLELENAKLQGWFYSGGELVSSISFLISLSLGAYFVSKQVMTVGSLLTFINLVNHLVYPLTGLASHWARFQRAVSATERVNQVLEQPTDSRSLPTYIPSTFPIQSSIRFHNVTFRYDDKSIILDRFNLTIPVGKMVAFVGPSGVGKSTLFHLLQGFYSPQSGSIFIDDTIMNEYSKSQLRSAIAHVPQESFLFAGTIRENLLIARPNITELEMIHACMNAQIHPFIEALPCRYDTEIGEKGVFLSGGQKQRISIARAILKNAPILLLDEATSSLDSETEYKVNEALDHLRRSRTTIVIAHRLSTIQNADIIVVMDDGKIVQTGTHEELIEQHGLYQKLARASMKQTEIF